MASKGSFKRVGLASIIGGIAVLGALSAYADWKWRQALQSCLNVNADGSEEILYGEDCIGTKVNPNRLRERNLTKNP